MKMTGIHECALQITIAKMVDAGEEEYTGGLREILSLVRGLADGSLRCADSKTEVVVPRAVWDIAKQLRDAPREWRTLAAPSPETTGRKP